MNNGDFLPQIVVGNQIWHCETQAAINFYIDFNVHRMIVWSGVKGRCHNKSYRTSTEKIKPKTKYKTKRVSNIQFMQLSDVSVVEYCWW